MDIGAPSVGSHKSKTSIDYLLLLARKGILGDVFAATLDMQIGGRSKSKRAINSETVIPARRGPPNLRET